MMAALLFALSAVNIWFGLLFLRKAEQLLEQAGRVFLTGVVFLAFVLGAVSMTRAMLSLGETSCDFLKH